jgi:hypothetical protein
MGRSCLQPVVSFREYINVRQGWMGGLLTEDAPHKCYRDLVPEIVILRRHGAKSNIVRGFSH